MIAMPYYPSNARIEEKWPIGRITGIHLLKKGVINKMYKIRAVHGAYILRMYTSKNAQEVSFEIALLKHIRGLPVPRIIQSGDQDIVYLNSLPAVIYKFIEGAQARKLNKEQREDIGVFLAQFHKKGKHFRHKGRRPRIYSFSRAKRTLLEREVTKKFSGALLNRFFSIARDVSHFAPNDRLPRGPIHVDIKPENVLFSNGKLSGVIDFDNAYIGPFLLDLAKSMAWFGLEKKRFDIQQAFDIYAGYISVRSLTSQEYKELYKVLKFAFASHLYVDYYMKAIGKIPTAYFKFLMNDFYNSYLSFSKITGREFYEFLNKKHD